MIPRRSKVATTVPLWRLPPLEPLAFVQVCFKTQFHTHKKKNEKFLGLQRENIWIPTPSYMLLLLSHATHTWKLHTHMRSDLGGVAAVEGLWDSHHHHHELRHRVSNRTAVCKDSLASFTSTPPPPLSFLCSATWFHCGAAGLQGSEQVGLKRQRTQACSAGVTSYVLAWNAVKMGDAGLNGGGQRQQKKLRQWFFSSHGTQKKKSLFTELPC